MTEPAVSWKPSPRVLINASEEFEARYTEVPAELIATSRALLEATLADAASGIPTELAELVDARTEGRFRAESEALAKLVGSTWQNVMLANISYDIALSRFACSTAAIATADGPVLFRNLDWWPEQLLAQGSCVLRYHRAGQPMFESAGWVASSGVVTGLSHRGFAIAINAVSGLEGTDLEGFPVLLFLRTVLEDAESFDQAVQLLSETRLASSALFMIVGRENSQRVLIERTPTRSAHRRAEGDAPLIATNDYRALTGSASESDSLLHQTACGRFDALSAMSGDFGSAPGDGQLLAALAHPSVKMDITAQHIVAHPTRGSLGLYVPTRWHDR